MTEFTDLTALFGAIDAAVEADPGLAAKVAPLLPAYAQGAAGWYGGLALQIPALKAAAAVAGESVELAAAAEGAAEAAAVTAGAQITQALENLQDLGGQQPVVDEYAARLLLAIAVLGRIWPTPSEADSLLAQQLNGLSPNALVGALGPVTVGNDETKARQLLALLADETAFPGVGQWDSLLDAAVQQNLLPPVVAGLSAAPCAWTVVPHSSAGGPAVAFETRYRALGVTQNDFADLLDPTKWVKVQPPWCAMQPRPVNAPSLYLEILSAACPAASPIALTTPLQFVKNNLPDGSGQSLEYRLTQNPTTQGGDGVVSIDEGSLIVRESQGAVYLITSKRIQFTALKSMAPVKAAWLAQLVWVLGYALLPEYFVNKVTGQTQAVVTTSTVPASMQPDPSRSPLAAHLSNTVPRRLRECVAGLESSLTLIQKGSYGSEDYVKDLVTLADHAAGYAIDMLQFWAGAGTSGTGKAKTGARTPLGAKTCVSETFDFPPPAGPSASQPRTLVLDPTTLTSGLSRSAAEKIDADAVRFVPPILQPGVTSFTMEVDRKHLRGQPGGTYTGTVKAEVQGAPTGDTCPVWIVVP